MALGKWIKVSSAYYGHTWINKYKPNTAISTGATGAPKKRKWRVYKSEYPSGNKERKISKDFTSHLAARKFAVKYMRRKKRK